jgi:hypothetical protein
MGRHPAIEKRTLGRRLQTPTKKKQDDLQPTLLTKEEEEIIKQRAET